MRPNEVMCYGPGACAGFFQGGGRRLAWVVGSRRCFHFPHRLQLKKGRGGGAYPPAHATGVSLITLCDAFSKDMTNCLNRFFVIYYSSVQYAASLRNKNPGTSINQSSAGAGPPV